MSDQNSASIELPPQLTALRASTARLSADQLRDILLGAAANMDGINRSQLLEHIARILNRKKDAARRKRRKNKMRKPLARAVRAMISQGNTEHDVSLLTGLSPARLRDLLPVSRVN